MGRSLLIAVAALAACSPNRAVEGQFTDDGAVFTGTLVNDREGGAVLTLAGADDLTCSGEITYFTQQKGEGRLTCSNGWSGPVRIFTDGRSGTGTGQLRGRMISFAFE